MASFDDALIENLRQLDEACDLSACLRILKERQLSADELFRLALLLYRERCGPLPLEIARQLTQAGIEHWVLLALAAHLALRFGDEDLANESLTKLVPLLADGAAARQAARELLAAPLIHDVLVAFYTPDQQRLRDLARLWSLIEPEIMQPLAPLPAGYRGDPERPLRPSAAGLLRLDAPSPDAQRQRRRVVLAIRRYWIADVPTSRVHEIPLCLAAAMEAYGWEVIRYHLRSFTDPSVIADDYRAIDALCRESGAELLVLDDFLPEHAGTGAPGEIMRRLKVRSPQLRLVGLYLDCWQRGAWDGMEAAGAMLDACWASMDTPVWHRAAFRDKVLLTPMPNGGSYSSAVPLRAQLYFHGGVQQANWYRAFWLTAMADAGFALEMAISTHQSDGLEPLESYRRYLRRLGEAGATLNFARRRDGQLTVTGRTFEVLAAGGLLVQERCDEIDLYLIPGSHYLRFESLADLADIAELLREAPDRADEVRRAGAEFFRERYADDKIIGYLDQLVFHRHSAANG
ncbi:MAG TPA: glycosyltransferase [Stellaceae bacterium]|nr:glycosyltransferase [Stellaceae bacterium]